MSQVMTIKNHTMVKFAKSSRVSKRNVLWNHSCLQTTFGCNSQRKLLPKELVSSKKSVSRSSVAFHNFLSTDIIYKQKQNINKLHPVYKYTFTRNEFPLKQVNNPRTRVPLTYYRSGTTILRLPSVSGSRNDQYTEVPRKFTISQRLK